MYLAIILDVFTQAVRGWCLSRILDQELTLTALQATLGFRQPEIYHSNQVFHYTAYAYVDLLKSHGTQFSMAAVGKTDENSNAERFMHTIKEEEVELSDYQDFRDASSQIGRFIEDVYVTKRIHSALGYLTPVWVI